MKLTPKTKIGELLQVYPFLQDYLIELSPKFNLLKNPIIRKTIGSIATLSQASTIGGIEIDDLIVKLGKKIEMKTGDHLETETAKEQAVEKIVDSEARHEVLKDIIRDLHAGVDFKSIKNRFARLIADIDASEISKMEQKLIDEGMPADEVKRLCDVHVQIFKEALEEKEIPVVPEGHPVHTFMLENRKSEELMDELERILDRLGNSPSLHNFKEQRTELYATLNELRKIDFHYLRKENQLFPILEGRGISGPSSVMWALHDDIRGLLRNSRAELDAENGGAFVTIARELIRTIRDMIYKEERILYHKSKSILLLRPPVISSAPKL